ncbi:sigma-70 family RNA polymerase sigma factor [Eubacteriaceae bacterium ES3]|nr:sigma-70 family RNA polymerase sigma factor [Eubacteriaceae bacterium ES3]
MTNEELVKSYQNGDKQAMDRIVENNKGLVFMVVNRYMDNLDKSYLERDDLEQLGIIGLMEAVKGFDHSKGFKFSSYASTAIMGYITRGLRVSTPWEKRSDSSSRMCNLISANEMIPGTEDLTYLDSIDDPEAECAFEDMLNQVDNDILAREINATMDRVFSVGERERKALELRYGLNDYPVHTLKEIGAVFNVTIERSRGLVNKGLLRIRNSRAGLELKRKYIVEFGLAPRIERLTRLEYKDPATYTESVEELRQRLYTLLK